MNKIKLQIFFHIAKKQYFCKVKKSYFEDINRSILRLSLPSILANITIPLVGIVDVAITGHLSDASAVGGIAVGTMLFDLLYWNFGFLRVGTSGMTAQAYGRGDKQAAVTLLLQSTGTAFIGAAIILLLQWFFVTAVLYLMPCSDAVADFARQYFFIRIWAAPATLALMALKGWFIGMQNTIAAMIVDIVVNVVNMAASFLLAVYTPLGAMGVAWGTLIAQYAGLITALSILAIAYHKEITILAANLRTSVHDAFQWTQISRLMSLNANLFVRSLCFMVIYVGYTIIASDYGDTELAVSAILMKLFMFFSYFADGFAYAGEALVGKLGVQSADINEYGSDRSLSSLENIESTEKEQAWRRTKTVDDLVRVLLLWAVGIGVLFTAIYGVFREPLIGIMTNDETILTAAGAYYIWLALMPLVSSLAFVLEGIYIGATAGVPIRRCMIYAAIGFVVTYVALYPLIGTQALYAAYFSHLIIRTIYMSFYYKKL